MNTIEQAMSRAAAMRTSWVGESAITPKGAAVVTVNRLRDQLAALDTADRDEIRELLDELVAEQDQAAWAGFGGVLTAVAIGEHRRD